jgi:predicted metal-dependent peptidase
MTDPDATKKMEEIPNYNNALKIARANFDVAKNYMVRHHPFYASFLLGMEIKWDLSTPIAGTDGKKFYFNPITTDKLKLREWNFLICHEVMHVAHMHPFRRGKRHPMVWNIACDYSINELIMSEQDFHQIKGTLVNEKYKGESPEQIYSKIEKDIKQQIANGGGSSGQVGDGDYGASGGSFPNDSQTGAGHSGSQKGLDGDTAQDGDEMEDKGQGDPNQEGGGYSPTGEGNKLVNFDLDWLHGDIMDPADMDEQEVNDAKQRARALAFQAAYYAKAMGADTELTKQIIDSQAPKAKWQLQLQNFVTGVLEKDDYTWARCNRRYIDQGVYLPTLGGTKPPKLMAIAIDTSGSISQEQFKLFQDELSGLLASNPNLTFLTYFVNTEIQKRQRLRAEDIPIKLQVRGGGGTNFKPAFEDIDQSGEPVSGLIYFTDLECWDYGAEPEYPVVWLNFGQRRELESSDPYTSDQMPPWGDVVNMR